MEMKTIGEISRLSGVSIRALRHYDSLGLLKPAAVTDAGYRLYDDGSLARLAQILLFRELDFPLADIKRILEGPAFDAQEALRDQLKLLELRRERLNKIIEQTKSMLEEGDNAMDISSFKNEEYEKYAREAKEKWGNTPAYAEYEAKLRKNGEAAMDAAGAKLMARFAELGALRGGDPAGKAVQQAVCGLQAFITENFYKCTDEILSGLGEMYVADERFKRNIDSTGGEGTAEFVREAIRAKTKSTR